MDGDLLNRLWYGEAKFCVNPNLGQAYGGAIGDNPKPLWGIVPLGVRAHGDIEDVAVPSSEPCCCGRGLALIGQLAGRLADILTTPDGQFVSASALTTILPKIRGLDESQLVQRAPDWLQVNVVRRPNYDETSEATFVRHLSTYFGPTMRITFNYVDEIPKTASGKTRFSISEIGDEE